MEFQAQLIAHINELVSLNATEQQMVLHKFKARHLKKKEHLLSKGDVSSHMRFIASGCLRGYEIDKEGQEHVLQFGIEGWWINDLYSYLTQTPANCFIQALEPSTVLMIHRDSLEELFSEVPAMERFFRLKIQGGYVALQERTLQSMSQTAEKRYLHFREKYRNMEQRIPQYMIASYLGITPEFLSAIRRNLVAGRTS